MQISFKLPGLAKECQEYIEELKLTDISISKIKPQQWKKLVKDAVREKNELELRK